MKVAEDFLGPEINAAFAGITRSEFDHGDSLRPEEQEQRDDPEPDGYATVGRNRRDNVEIENGNDKEQHQVALAENSFQMRARFRGGDLDCQLFLPKIFAESRLHTAKRARNGGFPASPERNCYL